jgi:hypothetical protein
MSLTVSLDSLNIKVSNVSSNLILNFVKNYTPSLKYACAIAALLPSFSASYSEFRSNSFTCAKPVITQKKKLKILNK